MVYKVGQTANCLVYTHKGRKKFFLGEDPKDLTIEKMSFEIISINRMSQDRPEKLYMLLVPEDMSGWQIGQWRIDHQGVDPKFLNKKFYEVGEYYLNREIVRDEPKETLEASQLHKGD